MLIFSLISISLNTCLSLNICFWCSKEPSHEMVLLSTHIISIGLDEQNFECKIVNTMSSKIVCANTNV